MKNIKLGFVLIGLSLLTSPVMAVKIYECVDDEGNSTFQDTCPPGTTKSGEKSFYTGSKKSDSTANPDVAVTLYTVPTCDACDVVKGILNKYSTGFTEKNIENNVDLQRELQEKSGGGNTLSVPTVIIGEKVIVGYNKQSLVSSLEEAGFSSGEEASSEETGSSAGQF